MNAVEAVQAVHPVDPTDPRFTYSQAVHILTLLDVGRDEAYRAVSWTQLNPRRPLLLAGVRLVYRGGADWWHIDRHQGNPQPI